MKLLKIVMLQHLSGDVSYDIGKSYDFPIDEAIRLIDADIAKPKSKQEYQDAITKIEKEKEQKEEDERRATAILNKHNLEKERNSLQNRVDAITHILDDGEVYYKVYGDLADDLAKQKGIETTKEKEDETSKKDVLSGLLDGEGK
ncbi:hypothetical protein [Aliarcobacter butzleri]|uniref:hypothetical protein n=1 Tax=Aliarcobacter butzleri TaxID=28197 RepID=UPI00125EA6DA|nr:hypothetical protein [Aliarcobacter butzleri]MDS1371035.1 hypothetical protein [Aliarcobacter butzleri]